MAIEGASHGVNGLGKAAVPARIIEFDKVVAGYSESLTILNETTLDARASEITLLIGPNGAGKSTVLKTLFGMLTPRAGEVRFEGRRINGRPPRSLLAEGIALYEARATLAETRGSGTPLASGSSGRFSLHAKALVFDRDKVLIGAMNYDKRSLEFNTELGLVVHSPELARQVVRQFDSIANPANSYEVASDHNGNGGPMSPPRLLWRTEQDGRLVKLDVEPVRSPWQRVMVDLLLALPLDVLIGEADYH